MTTGTRPGSSRLLVVVVSTAAAVGVWALTHLLVGVPLEVRPAGRVQPVGLAAVLVAATGSGLLGWLLVAVLARRATHPRRIWLGLSLGAAAVSLLGPLGLATSQAAALSLAGMHAAVALTLIPGLARTMGPARAVAGGSRGADQPD